MRPIRPKENEYESPGVPLDDAALQQQIRSLALTLNPDGAALLKFPSRAAVHAPLAALRAMTDDAGPLPASAGWLLDSGRLTESLIRSLCLPNAAKLPSSGGLPRMQRIAREIIRLSGCLVTADRLAGCLQAFDEVRTLTMAELWAAPGALAAELCREYVRLASDAVQTQRDRLAALRWIDQGADAAPSLAHRSAAFFECALHTLQQLDRPEKHSALTAWLSAHDRRPESLVPQEHERQALYRLLLGNILTTLRLLDRLDWSECFGRISRVEQTLLADPAGTYPRMDAESCSQVRARLARLAVRLGMPEAAVARCAWEAASGQEDIRREITWWLHTDAGTSALLEKMNVRAQLPRIVPDPHGRRYMLCVLALALFFFLVVFGVWSCAAALIGLPVLWGAAAAVVNAAVPRLVRPRPLLRMAMKSIPDECRTLVVMPALLSSPERAEALAGQLETLGCLETDGNLSFLLLGDLPDHDGPSREDDDAIILAAQRVIDRANKRAGRVKYHFLHRGRVLQPCEGRYMGRERKRGALTALNRLLVSGENEFVQPSALALYGRFHFVVTLDAGTRMLSGTAHRLVGALAHPINRLHTDPDGQTRGYALLSPRMELPADSVTSRFIELYGGKGGVDSYPTAVSDVYQDLCGQGLFGGKGIYDVHAFHRALDGQLPDNAILSHDLVEGLIARAGFLCDVTLYDGHPRTVRAFLARLNRWTRGDWQLIPLLFRKTGFSALDRYKIIDNLRRSLEPVSELLLVYIGYYARSLPVLLIGLSPLLLPLILHPHWTKDRWMQALARFSLLPQEAFTLLSAIFRALWRMTVSHRRLLQWVTADDADRSGGSLSPAPGWIASALLLPALVGPAPWLVTDVLLAALWWTGTSLAESLEAPFDAAPSVDPDDRALLQDLAARTFRFFADSVCDTGLPPDNVQLDPPNGAAMRTSPTNIGLYLASCVSARELGLISMEELAERASETLLSLEKMEKWHGHVLNWLHPETLAPLTPRYVSSVDSGNLAACLLMTARSLEREGCTDLSERMEALVRGMDFTRLFDRKRRLFFIGFDVENGRPGDSHYDLLASESRILSFTSMMLGQIPVSHWAHLGRPVTKSGRGEALVSWSGTMFEYLMPALFLPAFRETLLGRTIDSVIDAQIVQAVRTPGGIMPWGVSESGYYAFDQALNYQYRAFGLPSLSLRGEAADRVTAPYASMLALPFRPDEAAENLRRMIDLGFMDEHGLFEAADCARNRLPEGASFRVVRSHMAHHQGMILCALCNALADNALVRLFCDRPEAEALILLLQEKPAPRVRLSARIERRPDAAPGPDTSRCGRDGRAELPYPDTHLLAGGGVTALVAADGSGFVRRGDILLNRRGCDPSMPPQGLFVHLHDRTNGVSCLLTGMKEPPEGVSSRVRFEEGRALYRTQTPALDSLLTSFVSPEDGAFLQQITLTNQTASPAELDVTACFQVALAHEADYEAHPAFQNLFVESSLAAPAALCFRRRPRTPGQVDPMLIHAVSGAADCAVSRETDLLRLTGRSRRISSAGALPDTLSGTVGPTLHPCSALRVRLTLPAYGKKQLCFAAGLVYAEEAAAFIERHTASSAADRALELAGTQAREALRYFGLSSALHHALQQAAALLLYPRLRRKPSAPPSAGPLQREQLWPLGISGDLPILLARADRPDALDPVRDLIRAHGFYRSMGLRCDLVLVDDSPSGYHRPVRDRFARMIAASHLCGMENQSGGVHLIDGQTLSPSQRMMLDAAAALSVCAGNVSLADQLRAALKSVSFLPPLPETIEPSAAALPPVTVSAYNGFGGFTPEGYLIDRFPTPAPWCSFLCSRHFGALVSERGGGTIWYRSSRSGRVTPFDNDPLSEGWGDVLLIETADSRLFAPSLRPGRVLHRPGASIFEGGSDAFMWRETQFADASLPVKCHHLTLTARTGLTLRIRARIDFLMGVNRSDAGLTRQGFDHGVQWACGSSGDMAFARFDGTQARMEDGLLTVDLSLQAGQQRSVDLIIGCAKDTDGLRAVMVHWTEGGGAQSRLEETLASWETRLSAISLVTPDPVVNALVTRWLPYQTLCSRIWGRTGFYQPGGAFGFRDQLQDMLCLLPADPGMVRSHLILCAGHQFESGDVQHWWHPERTGVRTRISDDMLFLPFVTAEYVVFTQDRSILGVVVPFLKDEKIPDGQADWYGEAQISSESASLHEHCLRAIRRACRIGRHGLILMGAGDWNDGMNRVGHMGVGESVWLTEFMIVVLEKYAPLCSEELQTEFAEIASRLREAVETSGWDGRWYRRAFMDDGTVLGSSETNGGCRIDSLTQSWAVMAGLSRDRVKTAMNEASQQLIDREHGLIRLLTPPFDGDRPDPGYIRGYPPGVRENGGQYTHAACWMVMALAELGRADEAWDAFRMLLPSSHSDTEEKAERYRVEPYVSAGDVYSEGSLAGRGGWTWYTGSAAWLVRTAFFHLMGLKKRGEYATLSALLPKGWDEASVRLRAGQSVYTLTARRSCGSPLLDGRPLPPEGVRLVDDGQPHEAVFPCRRPEP